MIIIFILLGLGFLGAGAAAIVDGLPYMVLERGFTQVIIGTVMAVAGVLMLALSWVLVELRRLQKTVSGAAVAMSVASMVGSPSPASDGSGLREPSPANEPRAAWPPGLAAAGMAVAVGAGAGLAATQAQASAPVDPEPEPDLFGAHGAAAGPASDLSSDPALDPPIGAREAMLDRLLASETQPAVDPRDEPGSASDAAPAGEATLSTSADEPVSARDDEPPAEAPEYLTGDEAAASPEEGPDAAALPPGTADIDNPFEPESAAIASREDDEFGRLRDSLAGLGVSEPVHGRIEPSFADVYRLDRPPAEPQGRDADDIESAASWMDTSLQRRAPWFEETQPAPSEEVANPGSEPDAPSSSDREGRHEPAWPPQAHSAAAFGLAPPVAEAVDIDARLEAALQEGPAPAAEPESPDRPAPAPAVEEGANAQDDAAPAASDEGIVGAYQVGEAHFTIYADGSIQARTPDGDYSFASMDELKIYLASEKSRLGA